MKNIVFVVGVLSNGGAERVISLLSNEMTEKNYSITIITLYEEKNDYIENPEIKIINLNANKINSKIRKIYYIISRLMNHIKNIKPNILISFVTEINMYSLIAAKLSNQKIIISERNDPNQNPSNKYIKKIRNYLYTFSDGVVFQTKGAKNYYNEKIRKKSVVISNPLSSDLPTWRFEETNKTIITASRLVEQKNLKMLIDAFHIFSLKFPDYNLKIFGVGHLEKDLKEYVQRIGISKSVVFGGFTKNIHSEYLKSRLFVMSSNYEGVSNAVLESLAIGLPVISTDSPPGGAREYIINDNNGYLIEVNDTKKLTELLIENVEKSENLIRISNNSRKIKKELSVEKVVKNWIEFIGKVEKNEI